MPFEDEDSFDLDDFSEQPQPRNSRTSGDEMSIIGFEASPATPLAVAGAFRDAPQDLRALAKSLALERDDLARQLAEAKAEVKERREELSDIEALVADTRSKLMIQEKMASLGSLTAGIAHEIKNPLNFVNNFAQLSKELVDELRGVVTQAKAIPDGVRDEIEAILGDLEQNVGKINEHGRRADSIVKGMLNHSRGKSGDKTPIEVNVLVAEYVNLAYHGLRAQDSSFNVTIETAYDPMAGTAEMVPQDLSRVILNIVNNGCYSAWQKRKIAGESFKPTIHVSTKNLGSQVQISIRDNGTGIPPDAMKKIFEPFYTTKPTGSGTGLGLSISYDIIVTQHGGDLHVETEPGEFAEFIITLPRRG